MKNIFLLFIITPFYLFSQIDNSPNDLGRITLNVLLPEDSKIPVDSKDYFISKLNQIVASNGLAGTEISNPRFILTGSINELNHEQLSESLLHYYNLEVVLLIIDLFENKIFHSIVVPLKGVGNTKLKAYSECIKRIDLQSKDIRSFLENGKIKILNYYNTQCDFIQSNAKTLAKLNKYDEAIYGLSLVPNISQACYSLSTSNMIDIYKAKINFECRKSIDKANNYITLNRFDEAIDLLAMISSSSDCYKESLTKLGELRDKRCSFLINKAKSAWAFNNLDEATSYLSDIPIDSRCKLEASKMIDDIRKYVKEKEKRDWDLKLKIQNDEVDIRKATINAAKEVGVSYGRSQPKTIIYHNFKTFW